LLVYGREIEVFEEGLPFENVEIQEKKKRKINFSIDKTSSSLIGIGGVILILLVLGKLWKDIVLDDFSLLVTTIAVIFVFLGVALAFPHE
jgi:hypothetical protein